MFKAPSQAGLPPFSFLLDDMPASHAKVARHLGISERTIDRYWKDNQAPRSVMLALFWESRWGQSVVETDAYNSARLSRQTVVVLTKENAALRRRIGMLEQELAHADTGAANLPFFSASP